MNLQFKFKFSFQTHSISFQEATDLYKLEKMNSILRSIRNFLELISAECLHAPRDRNIADAADKGDLAAVRGHLRRDRRCLDQLFDGLAALHLAARYDRTGAVVAFLLAQGTAVDVVDNIGPGAQAPPGRHHRGAATDCGGRGRTPLHLAAANGLTENAQLLLAAKASVDIKNNYGPGASADVTKQCWKKMAFIGKRAE